LWDSMIGDPLIVQAREAPEFLKPGR
jgi:hypothetical protein